MKKLTVEQINKVAEEFGLEGAALRAFAETESGSSGFIGDKLVIQFEPTWFSKFLTRYGIDHVFERRTVNGIRKYYIEGNRKILGVSSKGKIFNGIEGQTAEWIAFNEAFYIHSKSAMLSTSIGIMQVMGFNYAECGYKSVDEMWDDFKKGEVNQLRGACNFIKNKPALFKALKEKNWHLVATYYNGEGYKELAKQQGRTPYDKTMQTLYNKYKKAT